MCNVVLSAKSMKPSKLRCHSKTKHPQHAKKDAAFFQCVENSIKRQELDATVSSHQEHAAVNPCIVSSRNSKLLSKKKPHLNGETLLKSCMLKSAKLVLRNTSAAKLRQISLSNNTIQRHIADMSKDVKELVVSEIKASPKFLFQVDKSTDIHSCAQLLVFVKYIQSDYIKEFLLCSELDTITPGADDDNFF